MPDKKEDEKRENNKCFVMMPISDQGDYPKGHFNKVYEQIFIPAIKAAGFEPYRVDENKICDPIMNKIFDAIQNCPMALCDLSNRNPNVLYELGLRQAYDKPVVLVQDDKTERIFDVSGINTVEYNSVRLFENVIEARNRITEAIISTRDGNENSIVKIMKAGIARYSDDDMSKEDKIEVILNGIMRDIQDLKQRNIGNYARGIDERNLDFNYKMQFNIPLKRGITNKQIEQTMKMVEKGLLSNAAVTYSRVDNMLLIDARMKNSGISEYDTDFVEKYLMDRLS